jgi:hypothetical protein
LLLLSYPSLKLAQGGYFKVSYNHSWARAP